LELKNTRIAKFMKQRNLYREQNALAAYWQNESLESITFQQSEAEWSAELALAIENSLKEAPIAPLEEKEDKATRLQLDLDMFSHNLRHEATENYYLQIICAALSSIEINKTRCAKLRRHMDAFLFARDDFVNEQSHKDVIREFNRAISDFREQMHYLPDDQYAIESWDVLLRFLRPKQMTEVKAMLFF
jgi:hypothetical protein